MAETTNLTTTITSEEYAQLLWRIGQADRLAEAVAADWFASTGFGFNKPSDATLEALRRYDDILHHETEKKIEEAEAARKNVEPPITTDDNPLRIEVGDRPDLEPKITC